MGRKDFLTLPTALRAGGPFASSAAQILVAAFAALYTKCVTSCFWVAALPRDVFVFPWSLWGTTGRELFDAALEQFTAFSIVLEDSETRRGRR